MSEHQDSVRGIEITTHNDPRGEKRFLGVGNTEVELLRVCLKASEDMQKFYRDRAEAQDRQITALKATIEAQSRAIEHLNLEAHAQQTELDERNRKISKLQNAIINAVFKS